MTKPRFYLRFFESGEEKEITRADAFYLLSRQGYVKDKIVKMLSKKQLIGTPLVDLVIR